MENPMSPEERQLIAGLFERTKSAASTPRDQAAEAFISEQIKAQPAAPYLLAQTVIVQDQALHWGFLTLPEKSHGPASQA